VTNPTNAPSFDADAVRQWLTLLHATSRGYVHICRTGDWVGRVFDLAAPDWAGHAVAYAEQLDASAPAGIYARITSLTEEPGLDERGSPSRGGEGLAGTLPALWADLDIAGPGHKTAKPLPPDEWSAQKIVTESGLPDPTLWVHSGGGLYPIWRLDPAHQIDDLVATKALSEKWQKAIEAAAVRLGWSYGAGVGDLARVLRVPGTVNRKDGLARPCRIVSTTGPTYAFGQLIEGLAAAIAASPLPVPPPRQPPRPAPALVAGGDISPNDAFEAAVDWEDPMLLSGLGWSVTRYGAGGYRQWVRPDASSGNRCSATTGREPDRDRLYVFSDATVFPQNEAITKPYAYALIHHGGNASAAAKDLYALGYGSRRTEPAMAAATPTPAAFMAGSPLPSLDSSPPNSVNADHGASFRPRQPTPPEPGGAAAPTLAERVAQAEMEADQVAQDFWSARPYLKHIEIAAHARQRSAPAVLGVVLARVAAIISHRIRIPPVVGAETGLSLLTVICAPPGVGKSTANAIGQQLVPVPFMMGDKVADQLPIGTGEGLVESFMGTVDEVNSVTGKTVKIRQQVRNNAFVFVDEGQVLGELGNRKGATLLPTLRTAFTGGLLGNANASEERRRIIPAGAYTVGIVVAMQTALAGALLDDADGGTPQRMLWLPAIDPTIPDVPPPWPGPLSWQPPSAEAGYGGDAWLISGTPVPGPQGPTEAPAAYLVIAEAIQQEIRATDLARARGEVLTDALDAHEGLLRLKVAALLAILDGRLDVGDEDWALASTVKAMSDRMRSTVSRTVAERNAQAEVGMSEKLARRAAHQDAVVASRRVAECAQKIAAKVRAEPDRWTAGNLRREPLRRFRDEFDDGLELAKAEGWVIEVSEPGHGDGKRAIKPGAKCGG
jgi:hypothetical protein